MPNQKDIAKGKAVPPSLRPPAAVIGSVGGALGVLNSTNTRITPLQESTFTGRIGEVQASPTANTLLARVKTTNDTIGEVQASPTANTLLDRIKTTNTTIGEVQASPTANTVLDRIKTTNTALGEVQASPTANTVLDRLKTIGTQQTSGTQLSQIVDPGNAARKNKFDSIHMAIIVTQIEHQEIHDGKSFSYRDTITLGAAGTQDYLITTPNTTAWAHFGYEFEGQSETTMDFYEATDKAGTTAQTNVYDRNRNTNNSATTTIHKGTSGGTTDGTLLLTRTSGSATGSGKGGAQVAGGQERVLKQNTKYILRLTSAGASNKISIRLSWYEHVSE